MAGKGTQKEIAGLQKGIKKNGRSKKRKKDVVPPPCASPAKREDESSAITESVTVLSQAPFCLSVERPHLAAIKKKKNLGRLGQHGAASHNNNNNNTHKLRVCERDVNS